MDRPKYTKEHNVFWGNSVYHMIRSRGPCYITSDTGYIRFNETPYRGYSRNIGPAVITGRGSIFYYNKKSKRHRTDGPAIIFPDSTIEYWVDGEQLHQVEFFLKYGVM